MQLEPDMRNRLNGIGLLTTALAGTITVSALAGSTNGVGSVTQRGSPQYIYVFGEVLAPGRFPWTKGMTLTNSLDRAGGFSMEADRARIEVRSGSSTQVCSFATGASTPAKNPPLLPGSTVFVPRNRTRDLVTEAAGRIGLNADLAPPGRTERVIYVEGEVRHAGRQRWTNDMKLSVVVGLAGGFTEAADPTRLQIRHQNASVDIANYLEATNSPSKDNLLLRGDRIIVPRKERKGD
jgi:protein involved in polysaccharide export with SLBB domain